MTDRSTSLLAIAFILLWNSGFIGAEIAVASVPVFTLLLWRYLGVLGLLAVPMLLMGRIRWPGAKAAGLSMLIGLLSHGVWLGCVIIALQRGTPAAIVALVVSLQPLIAGAFSGLITGERTSPLNRIGLVLGFAGVCVVLVYRIDFNHSASAFAYLIPFVSAFAMALASLIERWMDLKAEELALPADLELLYQSLGTVLVVTPLAITIEGLQTHWSLSLVLSLIWLIVLVSLGAYALMWKLIARMDAISVSSLFYFNAPVTMIMAGLCFGDTVQVTDFLGLAIVFVGVALTLLETGAQRRQKGLHDSI